MKIPYFRFKPAGNELKYLKEVLDSGWLTSSEKAIKLEQNFKDYCDTKHSLAVNSCTSGLHLALEALGVKEYTKVLVPTWTFTASAEVIEYLGATPIFCDVDYATCTLSPDILEEALKQNPDISVLILVHFGGQSAELRNNKNKGILDICDAKGIKVIHDAAHAFPSSFNNKKIGSFKDITCFSFYANKTITSGEGGMILTDDSDLYNRMKLMRLHGINRDAWDRFTSSSNQNDYDIVDAGFKYNLSDLNAAVVLAQLEAAEELRLKRESIASRYFEELGELNTLDLPRIDVPLKNHSWHLFNPILNDQSTVSRDELIIELNKRGVGTSIHYKPLHRMSFYKKKYKLEEAYFPQSERIWKGCFSLPIFPDLQEEEQSFIISTLKELLD